MKKILIILATFFFGVALLQGQTDTMYVMKAGMVINKQSIKLDDVDSIILYKPVIVIPATNIQTVLVTGGLFIMGSPVTEVNRSTNETQYAVKLSSFRMSKYEITNAQYATFLNAKRIGSNGIYLAGDYPTQALIYPSSGIYDWGLHYIGNKWIPVAGYENAPVTFVTWYGSNEYAKYVGGALPTEAQWEYACRAGTNTPFNTGLYLINTNSNANANTDTDTDADAVTDTDTDADVDTVTISHGKIYPVGSYKPNAFGLYDMHGNVWEWCSDWYGTYPTTAQTNPTGVVAGRDRVIRGGSWEDGAQNSRTSYRNYDYPPIGSNTIGFRVVFVP